MSVLSFANKSGAPAKHTLPENLQSLKKAEKLDCLHEMSAKVVDYFFFQHSAIVNDLVNHVVTEEERDEILNRQELKPKGAKDHLSTMASQEGLMNWHMILQYKLKMKQHYYSPPHPTLLQVNANQWMMYLTITVHFWQTVFFFLTSLMQSKRGIGWG